MPVPNTSARSDETLKSIFAQCGEEDQTICLVDSSVYSVLRESVSGDLASVLFVESDFKSEHPGSILNRGIALSEGNAIFLITQPVILLPGFVTSYIKCLYSRESIGYVYGNYIEERALGEDTVIAKTDNFDYSEASVIGPVQAMKKEVFDAVGYYDCGLKYSLEYDLRLRIFERFEIARVEEPLYRVLYTVSNPALRGSANPKRSYLDYNQEEEGEYRDSCYASLKRRGAFLSGPPVRATEGTSKDPAGPEISVVIPLYNREKYIGRTIESVLKSEWKRYEIIIVDNGSTDGGFEAASKYTGRGDITVLRSEIACNTAAALNAGIRHARGKYICQLDSDDLYTSDALSIMYEYMESNPGFALGVSYYDCIGPDDNVLEGYCVVKHEEYDRNNILRTDGVGAARIWRRTVLEEMNGFDEINLGSYAEDYDLVLRVTEKYDILRIPYVLYHYRINYKEIGEEADYILRHEKKTFARRSAIERRQMINGPLSRVWLVK
jgi:GT2 family glycosyltransferase